MKIFQASPTKLALPFLTALLLSPLAVLGADLKIKLFDMEAALVILADDLGYADIPARGDQGLSMPHLDELTRQGVRFFNGYVTSPQCPPSHCGLLTGIYNQRFGQEHTPSSTSTPPTPRSRLRTLRHSPASNSMA